MSHDEIRSIPKERVVTYASIIVDHCPQKEDPNRVRITSDGNIIKYPGKLTTRTVDLTTSKVLWNSVLSTVGARFMGIDNTSFYLETPLDCFEYTKIPLLVFPQHVINQYILAEHTKNGFVYLEIRQAIYGLPQAVSLANKLLRKRLAPAGYYGCASTPGIWRHVTQPIQFTLVVEDFSVKYVGKENIEHLLKAFKNNYKFTEDWEGDLDCGIKLDWNYKEGFLDISMPGYTKNLLQRVRHEKPVKPQHSPYQAPPWIFGTGAQNTIPPNESAKLDTKILRRVQKVISGIIYYACTGDITVLSALGTIACEKS